MAKRNTTTAPKRTAKPPAELDAAERLAAQRAAKRADEADKPKDGEDDERDEETDEDSGADDGDDMDKTMDDERDGDEDADTKDDGDDKNKDEDGKRTVASAEAKRLAEAAVRTERLRTSKITEIARQFGMPKLGERHVGLDTSVRAFKDIVLERLAKKQAERGNTTFAANSDGDVSRERGDRAPGRQHREMAEGETHWARVAGKPSKTA